MKPRGQRAPKITETQEHAAIAAYFRMPGLGGNAVAFHIRNERAGDWQRINAFKMGMLPGVPDWCIIDGGRAGFIEMKERGWRNKKLVNRTAKLTAKEERQIEVHNRLKLAGAWVEICETLEEVQAALANHGVPLRHEAPIIAAMRASLTEAASR